MALVVRENLPANVGDARDTGSIPGLEWSPGKGNGYPLQYSCLENPTAGCSPWGCKELNTTKWLSTATLDQLLRPICSSSIEFTSIDIGNDYCGLPSPKWHAPGFTCPGFFSWELQFPGLSASIRLHSSQVFSVRLWPASFLKIEFNSAPHASTLRYLLCLQKFKQVPHRKVMRDTTSQLSHLIPDSSGVPASPNSSFSSRQASPSACPCCASFCLSAFLPFFCCSTLKTSSCHKGA